MTSKLTELVIDCADPNGLARFWCSVLDYEVQDEDDGIVTIGSPMVPGGKNRRGPVPPTLTFAHVPEGKTVKNRLHLDVNPTDREQDEEVRRLLELVPRQGRSVCKSVDPGVRWQGGGRPAYRAYSGLPTTQRAGAWAAELRGEPFLPGH